MMETHLIPKNKILGILIIISLCMVKTQILFADSPSYDIHYTRLTNNVVESQIIQYYHYVDSVMPKEEYLTWVHLCQVGMIDYITIGYELYDDDMMHNLEYHFVCKIEGRDVIFSFQKPITNGVPFFYQDQQEKEQIIKNNFPKGYKVYLESLKSNDKFAREIMLYHCTTFQLEFKRGKLIKKLICPGGKPCITQEY
jgi:hypothetical protein